MKRRAFVKGVAATTVLSLTSSIGALPLWATDHDVPHALTFPPDYDGAEVSVGLGPSSIWNDISTETYRFGSYPGVTIRKDTGDTHTLIARNMLATPLAVHWHGFDVPSIMDGHPMDAIPPGGTKEYTFEIKNRAGTYFYHSHSHERVGREVNRGLLGLFLVSDAEEKALGLPSGARDIPLVVQDVRVEGRDKILYSPSPVDLAEGWLGNTVLVNGTPNAFHTVEPAWHRVRIVNGSNARIYDFKLSDGSDFLVIGGDGGLLASPHSVSSVMLGASERVDLLIDFSRYETGSSVTLQSGAFTVPIGHMGSSKYPQGVPYDILRFEIKGAYDNSFVVPTNLASIPPLPDLTNIPVRRFELFMTMTNGMQHTINDLVFDMMRTDFVVKAGSTEIWEIVNEEDDMLHPFHIHGRPFRVISKSSGPLAPHEMGYKDTILIRPGETVRLLMDISDYEGLFLMHCHNLEHEDEGMMLNFAISDTADVPNETTQSFNLVYHQASLSLLIEAPKHIGRSVVVTNVQGVEVLNTAINAPETVVRVGHLPSGAYNASVGNQSRSFLLVR